jgi:hypothetical protein
MPNVPTRSSASYSPPPRDARYQKCALAVSRPDINNVLVLGTDGWLWPEQAPWNAVPPQLQLIDGTVA